MDQDSWDTLKNPSPPPPRMHMISSQSSHVTLSEVSPENADYSNLHNLSIAVNNRFSVMALTKETVAKDSCGFSAFMQENKYQMQYCWKKQIDLPANNTDKLKCTIEGNNSKNVPLPEGLPKSIKIEDENYSDKLAHLRCKRYLRKKYCGAQCTLLHRYPKEDNVLCYPQKLGLCHNGSRCIYLHDPQDSDSSDDDEIMPECNVGSVLKKLTAGTIVRNNIDVKSNSSFKSKTSSDKDTNSKPTSFKTVNNLNQNTDTKDFLSTINVRVKKESELINKAESTKSSSSCDRSTTTMTTTTTLSEINVTKRRLEANDNPPIKKEKLDSTVSSIDIQVAIKQEPLEDEVLFKEESIDSFVGHSNELLPASSIKIEKNCYDIPTLSRLETVTLFIIDNVKNSQASINFSSNDLYSQLCEYLQYKNISIPNNVESKGLRWDILIRLFFINLLGTTDVTEYLKSIDKHLNEESFEDFIKKVSSNICPS